MDYPFVIFSGLCVLLNIIPFAWQIEHRNGGTICLVFWVLIINLTNMINSIVWRNDAKDHAPAFCDIAAKINLAGPLGILCSTICIVHFLARVITPSAGMLTKHDKRRRAVFECCLSLGFPILVMATHIIYQPTRYGISQTTGCTYTLVKTWPTYVLLWVWPPILAFIGGSLGMYVVYRLLQHRRDFGRLVANSNSALTTSRFIRLGLLSMSWLGLNVPFSIYNFLHIQENGVYENYDWNYVHSWFHTPLQRPLYPKTSFYDWQSIIAGLLVIIFFGFSQETFAYYGRVAHKIGLAPFVICNLARKNMYEASGQTTRTETTSIGLRSLRFGSKLCTDVEIDRRCNRSNKDVEQTDSYTTQQLSYKEEDELDVHIDKPFARVNGGQGNSRCLKVHVLREEQVV